jgi:hypothetical protein
MHRFLTESGGREERVSHTLTNIGPAVLNGGVSTFLAFILLAPSKSHVFSSFFKIFFLVVTFGLYHGLVFLPVLLSLIGPLPMCRGSYTAVEIQQPETANGCTSAKPVNGASDGQSVELEQLKSSTLTIPSK